MGRGGCRRPLGLRDRAILEVFYATGLRRAELTSLEVSDLHPERRTLRVCQGKGRKDRVVPLGERAAHWVARYRDEVRSRLLVNVGEPALFLTSYGAAFNPDVLSRQVASGSHSRHHRLIPIHASGVHTLPLTAQEWSRAT